MKLLLALVLLALPANEAGADCRCRSGGEYFTHDQVICLRDKLARCGMSLNNASWNIIAQSCPQVKAPTVRVHLAQSTLVAKAK